MKRPQRKELYRKFQLKKSKGRNLVIKEWIILKSIFEKQIVKLWNGFNC